MTLRRYEVRCNGVEAAERGWCQRGQQTLFGCQATENLAEIAVVESLESWTLIEGIVVLRPGIRDLVLRALRNEGLVASTGRGRGAKWRRTDGTLARLDPPIPEPD